MCNNWFLVLSSPVPAIQFNASERKEEKEEKVMKEVFRFFCSHSQSDLTE